MPHPFVNREVKTTLRWYSDPRLLNRKLDRCKVDNGADPYPWALVVPNRTIIPFQIRTAPGTTTVTSWKVYDLDGVEVLDLAANIGDLDMREYANPARVLIILEDFLLPPSLDAGKYEMVIVTNTGSYYSETFEVMCGQELGPLNNSNQADDVTFANWGYDNFGGLIVGVFTDEEDDRPEGLRIGDQKLGLFDNQLYTWDGTAWVTSQPNGDTYWTSGPGQTWYIYSEGEFVELGSAPVQHDSFGMCYLDGDVMVPWEYTPTSETLPGYVMLNFTIFRGSPFTGSMSLYVGGVLINTYTDADNGDGQEVFVYMEPWQTIKFVPAGGFNGCILSTLFTEYTDGTECGYALSWRNCGDLGTVTYNSNDFRNYLYLLPSTNRPADLTDPTPVFKQDTETNDTSGDVQVKSRKDVDWKLSTLLPWYALDALTETVACDDVRLRVPYSTEEDSITDIRFTTSWEDKCAARVDMVFRVDEQTVGDNCCGGFDEMCVGEGFASFELTAGGAGEFYIESPSGYFSVRHPDGTVTTHIEGVIELPAIGSYCAWSSDRLGNVRNDATQFYLWFSGATTVDLRGLTRLEIIAMDNNPALTCIDNTGCDALFNVNCNTSAMTEGCVDSFINNINAELDNISITIQGGTSAPPTSASATNRTAITTNGGTILTN